MLLTQVFKTSEGARKRARFETAHCDNKWSYSVVQFLDGKPNSNPFDKEAFVAGRYTYRLARHLRK